jgi:hypothetical protein
VNPVGADRRLWSFNRLRGDDEPGRERIDLHCREKIGRRDAGNNELSVGFSVGLQLASGGSLGDGRGAEDLGAESAVI